MKGPPPSPGGEDITWPDQVAPRGRKASSPRKIKPQTSNPICRFNFDFNPVCKTCSWNLFEVSKNDLKKCVFEIAALLQSQGEEGSALLGQSTPFRILCACTLPLLRL